MSLGYNYHDQPFQESYYERSYSEDVDFLELFDERISLSPSPEQFLNGTEFTPMHELSDRLDQDNPPMSTPDDPVIHSPPSIGVSQPPGMNGYANSVSATPIKMEDSMGGHCTSPDDSNGDTASEENRRRQKTCRVCGDHATGYNFNVITCESCKAFFRRNALRPKEFKCPYSEDCEINSVSRRFCQKCRLRKCFQVGMKKEWILNEEQLRRRKNSRLNNVSSTKRSGLTHPAGGVYQQSPRPLSIAPIDNQANIDYDFEQKNYKMAQMSLNNAPVPTSLVSPPGVPKYGMSSPVGSTASDSPPSHSLSMMHTNGDTSPDAYDPNMMMTSRMPMHQQQRNMQASLPHAKVDSNGKVTLSAEEYKQLLSRIPGAQPQAVSEDEPILKKSAYSQLDSNNHHVMPMNNGTPSYPTQVPNEMQPSHNNSDAAVPPMSNQYFDISSFGMGMATAFGGSDSAEEFGRRINLFCDTIIQQAIDSPDNAGPPPSSEGACILPKPELYDTYFPPEQRSNYQLNAAELRALDIVKDAFADIDDQLEQGPSLNAFLKVHKMPVDILHIIDVGMRRFVKVSKRIPAFHDLTQEGKLSLLKGGMIELLTLRGVTRYDVATNSFHTPTVKGVKVSVNVDEMFAKLSANAQSQKEKCLRFFRFFDDEVKRNDLAVYLVMCAVLFTIRRDPPMCENDCRIVTIQHDHFMCLLSRYLTSLYGDSARRLFERIPIALSMLNDISSNAGMLFMGTMRPDEAADLPKEFFKIE